MLVLLVIETIRICLYDHIQCRQFLSCLIYAYIGSFYLSDHFAYLFYMQVLFTCVNFNLCTVISKSPQMKPYAHGELAISLFLTILILYFHLSVSQYVADCRRGRYY